MVFWWLFQLQNRSHWIICEAAVVQAHLLTFVSFKLGGEKTQYTQDNYSLLFVCSLHLMNASFRIIWARARPSSLTIRRHVLFVNNGLDTCNFISAQLNFVWWKKYKSIFGFFSFHKGRGAVWKKSWWVRVQYQRLCRPTALRDEREHSSWLIVSNASSLSDNEGIVGGRQGVETMWQRGAAPNPNCSSHWCLLCGGKRKEFWTFKHCPWITRIFSFSFHKWAVFQASAWKLYTNEIMINNKKRAYNWNL